MNKAHTSAFYGFFEQVFDHYNRELFDNELPSCIVTIVRKKGVGGYFSPKQWGVQDGLDIDEIAINPTYFARSPLIDVLLVFVHQMTHLWQHQHGEKKGRVGYHNSEFVEKMHSLGIETKSKESPSGTGQKVHHSIIPDGKFLEASLQLEETGLLLEYADRYTSDNLDISIESMHPQSESMPEQVPEDNIEDTEEHDSVPDGLKSYEPKAPPAEVADNNPDSPMDQEQTDDNLQASAEPPPGNEGIKKSITENAPIEKSIPQELKDRLPENSSLTKRPIDTFATRETFIEAKVSQKKKTNSRTAFVCPACKCNAWGKPTLNIKCNDCDTKMIPKDSLTPTQANTEKEEQE